MATNDDMNAISAVSALSRAISDLTALGVIRSRRFTGDLGEWFVAQLYDGELPSSQTQKGWDILLPATETKLQVKTQTFNRQDRWNYLDSNPELFDRLVVVLLSDSFTLCTLYDIPTADLETVIRMGPNERRPYYSWDDLEPWQVDPSELPGYSRIAELIEPSALGGNERKGSV